MNELDGGDAFLGSPEVGEVVNEDAWELASCFGGVLDCFVVNGTGSFCVGGGGGEVSIAEGGEASMDENSEVIMNEGDEVGMVKGGKVNMDEGSELGSITGEGLGISDKMLVAGPLFRGIVLPVLTGGGILLSDGGPFVGAPPPVLIDEYKEGKMDVNVSVLGSDP